MIEYFICQHRYNTVKTVERGTVSTGKKGSTSTYSCREEKGRKEGGISPKVRLSRIKHCV